MPPSTFTYVAPCHMHFPHSTVRHTDFCFMLSRTSATLIPALCLVSISIYLFLVYITHYSDFMSYSVTSLFFNGFCCLIIPNSLHQHFSCSATFNVFHRVPFIRHIPSFRDLTRDSCHHSSKLLLHAVLLQLPQLRRPSVADWGGGMSASCTVGPIVR